MTLNFLFFIYAVLASFYCRSLYGEIIIPKEYRALLKDYRQSMERVSGLESSPLHWGHGIVIYCSKDAKKIYRHNHQQYLKEFDADDDEESEIKYKTYPAGTIFLKEQFVLPGKYDLSRQGIPAKADSLAVMIKRKPGFHSGGGDWEYLYFAANGTVIAQGRGNQVAIKSLCYDCHQNVSSRDYIFSRVFHMKEPF